MRVVIDTGVIVSALLSKEGNSRKALMQVLSTSIPLLTIDTLQELYNVLDRPKFKNLISPIDKLSLLGILVEVGQWVEVTSKITDCRDENDNIFLALALDGKADVLLSRDPDLVLLNPYRNIPILTPSQYLERFDGPKPM